MTLYESRPVGVVIAAPADEVYDFVGDPKNIHRWATGLTPTQATQVEGRWFMDSSLGRVRLQFAPRNPFGVADHTITLPDGTVIDVPLRVLANGDGAEVAITVRRRKGLSMDEWDEDCLRVADDLETLRLLFEREEEPAPR
ncbi:SRPBCC family protein [Rathayibacter toxicus]|uniref:Polyketide cyclase n=1 Tax=Rathayibacter toxicus TaxID=145458 RepID=A0A0C5BRI4_9MICO|nr:SRPBCC family protein [Rathayibacter toxicus]AJM77277.1 hypothetical protein TI83_03495 [Rathayibacter toxicus]ALS56856.1 hypothetical protein APU90_02975 [Rathayibacter toxicus]KKM46302.1 hypothetical protein VT73_04515 [Rathayibacter toxicus]PPG23274.1 polyketide cyclase [Rathayibacter toxicus]PPG48010.1 polyketide cyclase [Rathayibacter toxicus]